MAITSFSVELVALLVLAIIVSIGLIMGVLSVMDKHLGWIARRKRKQKNPGTVGRQRPQ